MPERKQGLEEQLAVSTDRRFIMSVDKELLDILACPKCKGELRLTKKNDGLVCEKCRLIYPIKDDIPVMLVDEATEIPGGRPGAV